MTSNAPAAEAATLSFDAGQKKLQRFALLSARAAVIEADLALALAPIQAAADKKLSPIRAELATLKDDLKPWWFAHKAALLKGVKKSAELAGCVLGTKLTPKKLASAFEDDQDAVLAIRKARLRGLLTISIGLDRKAIAKRIEEEPEGEIAKLGFKLEQTENFFVEPAVHAGRKA